MKQFNLILTVFLIFVLTSCQINPLNVDLIPVKSGNKWGYINNKGEFVINPQFTSATSFQDGIAKVKSLGDEPKYGYINEEGNYVINPVYTSATAFSEGIACVTTENSEPVFIDREGNTLFSLKTAQSCYVFSEGLALFSENIFNSENQKEELLFGFINKTGEKTVTAQFYNAEPFSCGLAAVKNSDNLWGFINTEGKIVINFQFEKAELFSEDIAVVSNGENWGAINKEGKYIINPQYEKLSVFKERKAVYVKDGKRGYLNKEGEIIINAQFDQAKLFNNGKACVKSNGLWGYIDSDGKYIINPQFKEASSFYGKYAFAESDDKYGIIDKDGNFTANPQFNDVYSIFIDYPTFYNIGLISYNDIYVKTSYFDLDKITNNVIRNITNESVNDIYQKSTINEALSYLNNLSAKKIDISSFSNYDKEVSISNIKITKDVTYSVEINFNKRIIAQNKKEYNSKSNKIADKDNSIKSLIYRIKLSGKARKKGKQILNAFESELSSINKSPASNDKSSFFSGEYFYCEMKLKDNLIIITFDFSISKILSDNPQDVAKEFLKAVNEQDYDTAKELGTENTIKFIEMIETMTSMASEGETNIGEDTDDITWGETEIDMDKAVCYYSTPEKSNQRIDLVLIGGEWKVDMKKEN